MSGRQFDLFVIGGGSGGVRAARRAAEAGARVALAEEYRFGGTCVIRGCVPKKLLVYASSFPGQFEAAAGFGWEVGPRGFDWTRLIANKDREIARLEGVYRNGLERAGVEVSKRVQRSPGANASVSRERKVKYALGTSWSRPVARRSFPTFLVPSMPSLPTRRSTCRNCPNAYWWLAGVTSLASLRASSGASERRSGSCTAGR